MTRPMKEEQAVRIADGTLIQCLLRTHEYHIPAEVHTIAPDAFREAAVHRIVLPAGMERIHHAAFRGCTAKEVVLPSGLRFIDSYAFAGCSLEQILLPQGLKLIAGHAFEGSALTSAELPPTVQIIGEEAFRDCARLRKAVLHSRILGPKAFWRCFSLCQIDVRNAVDIGGAAFAQCRALQHVCLPETLRIIGPYAFSNCQELKEIHVPDSVMEIGGSAFSGCCNMTLYAPGHLEENLTGSDDAVVEKSAAVLLRRNEDHV